MNKYRKQMLLVSIGLLGIGIFLIFNMELLDGIVLRNGVLGAFIIGLLSGVGILLLIFSLFPDKMKNGLNQDV
ncbi:MAG: hypothetical protein ABJF04_25055 [Reichenbachiella sp.]|uniref:hypothetical protein n=1 Tax=Reichenbachiella sp. TaxID=2184521 RepID=UPI003265D17D